MTDTKISDIFLEIQNQILQGKQQSEVKSSFLEKKEMVEEKVPCKDESEEHLGFPGTSTELMEEDEEIYRRLNIPWIPNEMQTTAGDKCIDSEKENLQRSIKKYKYQIEYMQETNDGIVTGNRKLREEFGGSKQPLSGVVHSFKRSIEKEKENRKLIHSVKVNHPGPTTA